MTAHNTLNKRGYHDHELFRVWPDGTVQHVDEPRHTHMSDDYAFVWAFDEDGAVAFAREKGFL